MKKILLILFICISLNTPNISAMGTKPLPAPQKLESNGFQEIFVSVDRLYISGQPDEKSFSKLKNMGVTTIINLRTKMEMNNRNSVPFDEEKVVRDLGMDYVHIPLGGPDNPYNKEALDKFAKAYEAASGNVLLHCTVAYRASHLWAAYLIKYKDYSPERAIENAKAINFGELPLEGFLGKKLKYKIE